MNDAIPLIEARGVQKTYLVERTSVEALAGVSVSVRAGETLSIIGPSGAGKSTLMHILGGLDRPTSGQVQFRGQDLYAMSGQRRTEIRATQVGFVFQAYHLLPELDIADNVMLPALGRPGALLRRAEHQRRALELLDRVGLSQRAHHRPVELSGGEQQRVALARALMNDPEIVMADEPTGNLDSRTGQRVLEYLFDLTRGRGHTLILVTHNEAVAALCQRTLSLKDGRVE